MLWDLAWEHNHLWGLGHPWFSQYTCSCWKLLSVPHMRSAFSVGNPLSLSRGSCTDVTPIFIKKHNLIFFLVIRLLFLSIICFHWAVLLPSTASSLAVWLMCKVEHCCSENSEIGKMRLTKGFYPQAIILGCFDEYLKPGLHDDFLNLDKQFWE